MTEKKVLYKFYKPNCPPCYALSRNLMMIDIPENIVILEKNVTIEENKQLAKSFGLEKVPALVFENGIKLVMPKYKDEIISFFECNK